VRTIYEVMKTLHVLGAVLFLGNILVTFVWKVRADLTGEARVVAFAQRLVTITDAAFTGIGAVLLLGSGLHLISYHGGHAGFKMLWLGGGFALFVLSGVIWAAGMIPVQVRQARIARGLAANDPIPEEYRRLSGRWYVLGAIATVLPVAALILMVAKPV